MNIIKKTKTLYDYNKNFETFVTPHYNTNYTNLGLSTYEHLLAHNPSYTCASFEKKISIKAFKQTFGFRLPSPATLHIGLAKFDRNAKQKISKTSYYKREVSEENTNLEHMSHNEINTNNKSKLLNYDIFCTNKKFYLYNQRLNNKTKTISENLNFKTGFTNTGLQLISAAWVCEQLSLTLKARRNVKPSLEYMLRQVKSFMNTMQSSCALKGLKVIASGRLSKTKKGMAQKISLSTGNVPLSTLKEKIDYDQTFVKTNLGTIGLKLWICFR